MNAFDARERYKGVNTVIGVPPYCDSGKVAIDTEFANMEKGKLHRPTGEFLSASFYFGGDTAWVVTDFRQLQEAMFNVSKCGWIFHNAKFDIFHLRRYAYIPKKSNIWDTMLIEKIMFSGLYSGFSLADLSRRWLNVILDKEVRKGFSSHSGVMSEEEIRYSALDAIVTYKVYERQREEIDEDDLKIWKEIEMPFLWVVLALGGIRLDVDKFSSLAIHSQEIADAIQRKYGKEVPKISKKTGKPLKASEFEGLNLSSPVQLKAKFRNIGFDIPDTGEKSLSEIADKCELAKDVLEFRRASKVASTYGLKFVENFVERDGKIYSDFIQIGAETGRSSSRNPNIQNQPNDPDYRECYIPDEGHKLVICDWSTQEPRFAAYLSGDERLKEIFNSGGDLYIGVARHIFGEEIEKHDPRRKAMKALVLGILYGMGYKSLAARLEISEDLAEGYINKFFESFPGMTSYVERQRNSGDFVVTVTGRKIWMNKYNNQWKRNCLNAPIQGSSADAMKLAGIRFIEEWEKFSNCKVYDSSPLLLFVHDEIVAQFPSDIAEAGMQILKKVMIDVAEELHRGIRGNAEAFVGSSWAEKH